MAQWVFGDLLKGHRGRKGITQFELAKEIRVNRNTIENWEKGNTRPRERSYILAMKVVLELSHQEVDQLLMACEYPPEYATETKDQVNGHFHLVSGIQTSISKLRLFPLWKKAILIVLPIILLLATGVVSDIYWKSSQPRTVFPQFGFGELQNNSANIAMMESSLLRCEGNCIGSGKSYLDIKSHLETGGYAVVNFQKLPSFETDLGQQLLLQIAVKTSDPHFEVGLWDDHRRVFFDCRAPEIGRVIGYVIDLDEKHLTKNGVSFRPDRAIGFSIGFANDAETNPGYHHMEVYDIISGNNFSNLAQVYECSIRPSKEGPS